MNSKIFSLNKVLVLAFAAMVLVVLCTGAVFARDLNLKLNFPVTCQINKSLTIKSQNSSGAVIFSNEGTAISSSAKFAVEPIRYNVVQIMYDYTSDDQANSLKTFSFYFSAGTPSLTKLVAYNTLAYETENSTLGSTYVTSSFSSSVLTVTLQSGVVPLAGDQIVFDITIS